jgi:hypothetical protein
MKDVKYFAASSIDGAKALLSRYGNKATVLAGGTDLLPRINYYKNIPDVLVYIGGLPLDYVKEEDGRILIGAGERISPKDISEKLEEIGYEIKPLDIVLVQTGADSAWGSPEYLLKGAGMDRESTLYLLEKGVKVAGIDAWSWDRPLPFLAKEYRRVNRVG